MRGFTSHKARADVWCFTSHKGERVGQKMLGYDLWAMVKPLEASHVVVLRGEEVGWSIARHRHPYCTAEK